MSKVIHNFEMEVDSQTMLYLKITNHGSGLEIENECMVTYLNGSMEVDIWSSLPDSYKGYFLEKAMEQYHKSQEGEKDFGRGA